MTLDEARSCIGRDHRVVYTNGYGPPEEGVITGVSKSFAFVRYTGDLHAKGTDPASLTLVTETATAGES